MKIKFSKHGSNKVETAQPEWWDQSCSLQKSKKFKALRKFRTTNSEGDFQQYKAERNHFKSVCKVKKKEFQKKRRSVFIEARNRPKYFWKTIKANTGELRYVKLAYLENTTCAEVIVHSRTFPLYFIVFRPCLCRTRL